MVQNKVGQILMRLDRRREAAQVYTRLTERYAQAGFLLKAIATCKMVLEAEPGHRLMQQRLAELYARQAEGKPRQIVVETAGDASEVRDDASPDPIDLPPPGDDAQDLIILGAATPMSELAGVPPPSAGDVPPEPEAPAAPALEPSVSAEPPSEGGEEDIPVDVELSPEAAVPAPEPASPETASVAAPAESESSAAAPRTTVLPQMPLFSDLPRQAFVELLERMRLIRVEAGALILREGEEGHSMFVIARGQVRVLRAIGSGRFLQLAQLGEGAFFGEMAVLRGGPRAASVQALSECELFEIERELLEEVAGRYPGVEEVLKKFAHQRMLRNVLATSPLFRPFEGQDRVRLIERFLCRDVAAGESLITEGSRSDGLYIVLRGRLEVVQGSGPTENRVGELREGEVFGEHSCLHQEPARATVRAPAPASVLRLPREVFSEVILTHPQILEMVTALGEKRQTLTLNSLSERGVMI